MFIREAKEWLQAGRDLVDGLRENSDEIIDRANEKMQAEQAKQPVQEPLAVRRERFNQLLKQLQENQQ